MGSKYDLLVKEKARLDDLRTMYILGELNLDYDDPRTLVGYEEQEVAYIRGETGFCTACGFNCHCDEDFENGRDRQ